MDEWIAFLNGIETTLEQFDIKGCDIPFFRGHNDSTWKLIPSLFRVKSDYGSKYSLERALRIEFSSNCGPLYDMKLESWNLLFEMRHAGLPTRLLDWTENFSSSLFFALRGVNWADYDKQEKKLHPCIWILDPYMLNEEFWAGGIGLTDDLEFSYKEFLEFKPAEIKKKFGITGPIAIYAPRALRRIFAQKSVYTLHIVNDRPIDVILNRCVKKFEIPLNLIKKAERFLYLSGSTEYSMFPDVDGLGRYLIDRDHVRRK